MCQGRVILPNYKKNQLFVDDFYFFPKRHSREAGAIHLCLSVLLIFYEDIIAISRLAVVRECFPKAKRVIERHYTQTVK